MRALKLMMMYLSSVLPLCHEILPAWAFEWGPHCVCRLLWAIKDINVGRRIAKRNAFTGSDQTNQALQMDGNSHQYASQLSLRRDATPELYHH